MSPGSHYFQRIHYADGMLDYSKDDLEKIKQLIAEGANQEAINALYPIVVGNDELEDTVVILKNRLATLQKSIREGTIARDDASLERNMINRALLDTLNILEDLDLQKQPKNTLAAAPSATDETPVNTNTHSVSDKQAKPIKPLIPLQWILRGGLALVTILVSVLIERSINSLFDGSPATFRDLTVHLVFKPAYPGIQHTGKAKLMIGNFVSPLQPIPLDGMLHFTNIPAGNTDDSLKVVLEDTDYQCKVANQSGYKLNKSDNFTAFVELESTTYNGTVLYPDQKPAAGVEIEFGNGMARDTTDGNGNYTVTLPNLKTRNIQVVVRRNGKAILNRPIGLHPDPLRVIKIPPG